MANNRVGRELSRRAALAGVGSIAGSVLVGAARAGSDKPASRIQPERDITAALVRWSFRQTADESGTVYDRLEPENGATRQPIVMVHGGAHTGSCYLSTPDGRPGWAQYFAARGHAVLVPDWPGTGRSGTVSLGELDGARVCAGLRGVVRAAEGKVILFVHSMSGAYGWKLLELEGDRISHLVAIAPAPPGNIQPTAKIVSTQPDRIEVLQAIGKMSLSTTVPMRPDRTFVNRKFLGESTQFPRETLARYFASLQTVPPLLLIERANVEGRQLAVRDFSRFAGTKALLVTGEYDIDHPRHVDAPIVDWLLEHGVDARFLPLVDVGIKGNGHMMMLERNSDQIAALVAQWLYERWH